MCDASSLVISESRVKALRLQPAGTWNTKNDSETHARSGICQTLPRLHVSQPPQCDALRRLRRASRQLPRPLRLVTPAKSMDGVKVKTEGVTVKPESADGATPAVVKAEVKAEVKDEDEEEPALVCVPKTAPKKKTAPAPAPAPAPRARRQHRAPAPAPAPAAQATRPAPAPQDDDDDDEEPEICRPRTAPS